MKNCKINGRNTRITRIHHKRAGTHFSVKMRGVPAVGSKLEYEGKGGLIIPYVITGVRSVEDGSFSVFAREANQKDYE